MTCAQRNLSVVASDTLSEMPVKVYLYGAYPCFMFKEMNALNKALEAVAIICLIVIGGAAGLWAYQNALVAPPSPTTIEKRNGWVAVTVTETEPSTLAANGGAASAYVLWHLCNGGAFPISSKNDLCGSTTVSGATTFGIGDEDNFAAGSGWKQQFVLQAYAGTADYIYMKNMLSGNSGIVVNHQENLDLGIDGYPEVLFLIDVSGKTLSATQALATPVAVSMFLTVQDVTLSDNSPADVDVAGTGAQSGSGVQNWQITVTTDNTGDSFVIGRIYLTFNDTETYLTPKTLTVTAFDGGQTVITSPTDETVGSTSYIYYIPTSGNYRWTYNGLLMYRSTGSNTYVNIGWAYDYSFASNGSGYRTNVILYLDIVSNTSGGGVTTSYNDAVEICNLV